jgi:hypothetical protein
MFFLLFSAVPQARGLKEISSTLLKCFWFLLFPAVSQAGGLKEISRWLSEAWRATPPVMDKKTNASRRDARKPWHHIARLWPHASGIPPGCGFYLRLFPVVSLVRNTRLTTG